VGAGLGGFGLVGSLVCGGKPQIRGEGFLQATHAGLGATRPASTLRRCWANRRREKVAVARTWPALCLDEPAHSGALRFVALSLPLVRAGASGVGEQVGCSFGEGRSEPVAQPCLAFPGGLCPGGPRCSFEGVISLPGRNVASRRMLGVIRAVDQQPGLSRILFVNIATWKWLGLLKWPWPWRSSLTGFCFS